MDLKKVVFFTLLAITLNLCAAKVEGAAEINTATISEKVATVPNVTSVQEKKPYSVFYIPDEFSWKSGLSQALVIGSVAICSLAIIGVLAYVGAPLLGFRMCSILGNCEPSAIPYSSGGNLQNPGQANSAYNDMYGSYLYSQPGYQKRSLNYIGPILKTLTSAYEKYEQNAATTTKPD